LCEALVSEGHQVTVYTTTANGKTELDVKTEHTYCLDGVNVIYFRRQTKDYSNFSLGLLQRLMKHGKSFDTIHIQSWWNMVAIPSAIICRRKGIIPVITPHGSISRYTFHQSKKAAKHFIHWAVARNILEYSILHSATKKEDNDIQSYIRNEKRFVIPNMLDLPLQRITDHTTAPFLKLIFVGRINPVKNLEKIIQVLGSGQPVPCHLRIIGDGHPDYVSKLREMTKNNPAIEWMGNVDGDEKYRWLANSDVLILPSFTENFGNVVYEALSQGTAVMVSENVGSKDYITDNDLGWVVNDHVGEWQAAIENAWRDQGKRAEIRRRAPECIRRDFNRTSQVREYIKMYQATTGYN
jgi:glycosyltransferase involved in cell wall biosynthesis